MPLPALKWAEYSREAARARVQQAIVDVVTPSWVGSIPRDFGEAAAGTMKAYQWRILWTIYIPLALVSIWHPKSPICSSTEDDGADVLQNVMHLAAAETLMCKHTVTPEQTKAFRDHISAHMDSVRVLFPGFGVPSYHTGIHIPDFMPLLGPARGWWCYPFERLIGKLQRMKHNHKYGK